MIQDNVNQHKNFLLGSTYSNRQRNPTLPSETEYKSSVKIDQLDRNVTLNVELLPLRLTAVLSGGCHFSRLV